MKVIFKKPGFATSILSNSLNSFKNSFLSILAISTGLILLYLDNIKAILVDISACCSLGGNSTEILRKSFG